jgi:hypothetical protein
MDTEGIEPDVEMLDLWEDTEPEAIARQRFRAQLVAAGVRPATDWSSRERVAVRASDDEDRPMTRQDFETRLRAAGMTPAQEWEWDDLDQREPYRRPFSLLRWLGSKLRIRIEIRRY